MLQLFQDEDAGAFADDEAVAVLVPGAAGALGLVIAGGERAHGGKTADAHGSDGGLGAAGDHDVGVAAGNDLEGVTEECALEVQAVQVASLGPLAP